MRLHKEDCRKSNRETTSALYPPSLFLSVSSCRPPSPLQSHHSGNPPRCCSDALIRSCSTGRQMKSSLWQLLWGQGHGDVGSFSLSLPFCLSLSCYPFLYVPPSLLPFLFVPLLLACSLFHSLSHTGYSLH